MVYIPPIANICIRCVWLYFCHTLWMIKKYINIFFQFPFKGLAANRHTAADINKTHIIAKNRRFICLELYKLQYFASDHICACNSFFFLLLWRCDPTRVMTSSFLMFLDHTQRRTTVGRTPLDEWWARRRDLYPTTHDTHNRQTSMTPVGFEPTISAGKRPQTYALDRAATGTGTYTNICTQ